MISFMVRTPLEVNISISIYEYLKKKDIECKYVVTPIKEYMNYPGATIEGMNELVKKTIETCEKNSVKDYLFFEEKWNIKPKVVVTPSSEQGLRNIPENTKKVCLIYAVTGRGHDASMRGIFPFYDLVLTPGKRWTKEISSVCPTSLVGYPKFDRFWKEGVSRIKITGGRDKKVIVYLPTWGKESTVDGYSDAINSLTKKYHVIFCVHSNTWSREKDKLKNYNPDNFVIFNWGIAMQDLYMIGDVILGDYSSATVESLYCDIPTIHLTGKSTGTGGPEETCHKEFLTVSDPTNYKLLHEYIERSIQNPDEFKEKRAKFIEPWISFKDGNSGERAGNAIMRLIEQGGSK